MIRAAVSSDASRLAEIQIFAKRTAFRPIFQNDFVSFQEMQVLDLALSFRDDPSMLQDVFVWDDGIVKAMTRWDKSRAADLHWELKELYVDPFFQGQGLGSSLMKAFLSGAEAAGMKTASLWVLEKNEAARALYSRYGFAPDGEKKLQEGTSEYLLEYWKKL
ncbi:MAG TPA: GNAT family N-acetyltransferase [Candidatus Lachnoclostridium stercorigallinarum]|uniref:GNAT family N-acetyltransferase n=1 Tax=Candidatus Lachnoclostridium stercorigallinarum TaxID=2838634 RepID=A0A9D2GJT5_9FIRM|nr:GNAT family N-acetyltransferase [Candidatus Lachnoclostridium stercorigallinarum]